MANFTPDGFGGEIGKLTAKYLPPPPPGLKPPFLWGTEDRLQELLGEGVSSLEVQRRSFVFLYPSPQFYIDLSREHVAVIRLALEGLDASKQEALLSDLEAIVHRFNHSGDETMVVPSDYLEVVAVRR